MKYQIINSRFCGLLCLFVAFWSLQVAAAPVFTDAIPAGPLRLYPDHKQAGLYYYTPGRLVLSHSKEGRPEISFLEISTEGKYVFGKFGQHFNRSILTLRVHREKPERTAILEAERELRHQGHTVSEIVPLPLKRIEARFDYEGVNTENGSNRKSIEAQVAADDEKSIQNELWTSRFFVVVMQGADANLFKSLLRQGPFASTISYTYWSIGISSSDDQDITLGHTNPVSSGFSAVTNIEPSTEPDALKPFPVLSDAIPIRVDTKRWSGIVTSLHVDEKIPYPPGYPLIEVYCFDFLTGMSKYIKRIVEIKADGVGGQPVLTHVRFSKNSPDITLGRVRFSFAVRTDKPINYRTIDYMPDGEKWTGDWLEMEPGTAMIDVSKYKEIGQ